MNCDYPRCMVGGGCDYEADCNRDDEKRTKVAEEKRKLDIEEQRLRIELLKRKLKES